MVKDAELHAEEDKKFQELVTVKNTADTLIHATNKSLDELGDKVSAEEQTNIKDKITKLEEVLKNDDKDSIEAATKELTDASGKLAEMMYAKVQEEQKDSSSNEDSTPNSNQNKDDDVVDADYKEVNDDKK